MKPVSRVCQECGGKNRIAEHLRTATAMSGQHPQVFFEIQGDPDALLFKEPHRIGLAVVACPDCGACEVRADDAAMRKALKRRAESEAQATQEQAAELQRPADADASPTASNASPRSDSVGSQGVSEGGGVVAVPVRWDDAGEDPRIGNQRGLIQLNRR